MLEETKHHRSLTTEQVNSRLEPRGLRLEDEYNGRCDIPNKFACMSVLKHTTNTLDNIWYERELGCVYCRKFKILDQVPICAYDASTYEHVITYTTFADLKAAEPSLDHQLLRNIIREERWLTPHQGRIYSVLAPMGGKLDLMKELTVEGSFIIEKLGLAL